MNDNISKEGIDVAEDNKIYSDHAYRMMTEIAENEKVTQRELSKELGLSLGSVNVLMNKMIAEGLVKIEQVSPRQVFYMLTPKGMMEKANKTISYLKAHYRVIYETKERIKGVLETLFKKYEAVYVLVSEDEMGEILRVAVDEYKRVCGGDRVHCVRSIDRDEVRDGIVVCVGQVVEGVEALDLGEVI